MSSPSVAGRVVVTHTLDPDPSADQRHHLATRAPPRSKPIATARPLEERRWSSAHLVTPETTHTWEQLELGDGDFDVDTPDLIQRYSIDVEDLA
ncbi:MAG: hypothetical protein R2715_07235 [Ilumatobacteraceae bacterium]